MKYLITGHKGQLGREFMEILGKNTDDEVYGFDIDKLDISNPEDVNSIVSSIKPDIILNCSAYNLVDDAEKESFSAVKANSVGPMNLAVAAKANDSFLVHYSSDYVFDGKKEGLYTEEDVTDPLNEYGKTKLYGEKFVLENNENSLVFRTSWVYGRGKQNFIYKLMQWAENNEYLKIAYDEISVPTSTKTIAQTTIKSLQTGLKGLFHLTSGGYCSRYEWAREILENYKIEKFIYPVSSTIFELPAKRPGFSAMDNSKISQYCKIENWKTELSEFLRDYKF